MALGIQETFYLNKGVRRLALGHSFAPASARPSGIPSLPPHASRGDACIARAQLGAPTLCLRKRTPQNHLLCGGYRTYLLDCLINEGVRRTLCVFVSWLLLEEVLSCIECLNQRAILVLCRHQFSGMTLKQPVPIL